MARHNRVTAEDNLDPLREGREGAPHVQRPPLNLSIANPATARLEWVLGQARARTASADLNWAAWHLRIGGIGERMAELLSDTGTMRSLTGTLDPYTLDPDVGVLEVAATSLTFGDVMTALDLVADALWSLVSPDVIPSLGDRNYADVGSWTEGKPPSPTDTWLVRIARTRPVTASVPAPLSTWLRSLLAHPSYALLKRSRDRATHRRFPRTIFLSTVDGPRQLSSIDVSLRGDTDAATADPENLRDIGELIREFVAFGENQLQAFVTAVLAAYPEPA